jgi:hypothetical protein
MRQATGPRSNAFWRFSNHASLWRRFVRERFPFDEELPALEDKEWIGRAMDAGYVNVTDPPADPSTPHRHLTGIREYSERVRRERLVAGQLVVAGTIR